MNFFEELILFSEAVYQLDCRNNSNQGIEFLIEEISSNTKNYLCEEDRDKVTILVSLREIMKPPIFHWLHEYNETMGNFPISLLNSEEGRVKLNKMCYALRSGQPV